MHANLHNLHNPEPPVFSGRLARDEDILSFCLEYEEWLDAVNASHADPLPADLDKSPVKNS